MIRGSAINNDGTAKVGFTAPSVEGQVAVISEALAAAGVASDSISYVETHGTGTPLGDPIEVAALTQAFADGEGSAGPCTLGAIKTNLGHLDTAAGVAGLIKTVQALRHRQIPPTLHFRTPRSTSKPPASGSAASSATGRHSPAAAGGGRGSARSASAARTPTWWSRRRRRRRPRAPPGDTSSWCSRRAPRPPSSS